MSELITDGPIFSAFKGVLKLQGKPLASDTQECSTTVVKLLMKERTSGDRPGMLLGKVQSGKTRAFVGAIAMAFDSGFDLAVVLTKTSTPLAVQTVRRLQRDLEPAVTDNRLRIHDAYRKLPDMSEWERNRKLIIVCKKHPKNLGNVLELVRDRYPELAAKSALIIDDEADFASVGYQRQNGSVKIRTIHTLINTLRTTLRNAVHLEVTATPYSLYLQPADIEEPSTGQIFKPVRPAFTTLVPTHKGYVGGDVYFDEALDPTKPAHAIHVAVPEAELGTLRLPAGNQPPAAVLTNPGIAMLRKAIITFVVGGTMRHIDEAEPNKPERLFSFIVHIDRLKNAHSGQRALAHALIDALKEADSSSGEFARQIADAHKDLSRSRALQGMPIVSLQQVRHRIADAFASISVEVVNGDKEITQLLDPSGGQLKQASPFNIYIGGQALDRGVTISNVIGFYYGRDPKVAQQDTTIQHCRMYGDRPREDVAVTRLYTSNGIYARMRRMHQFDKTMWSQIRKKQRAGLGGLVDPGDVLFLRRDDSGAISHCAANKVMLSRLVALDPGGESVPWPLTTLSNGAGSDGVHAVRNRLERLGMVDKQPFALSVKDAIKLIDDCAGLVSIDDGWDFDWEAMKAAIVFLAGSHPSRQMRDRVGCLVSWSNSIRKWRNTEKTDPQRSPYSAPTERTVRAFSQRSPALAIYHNLGRTDHDWSGSEFLWPVLFVPDRIPPVIFSNNRRRVRA